MNIWGITGTNGKTTTAWVFAEFLRAGGRKCGYVTTVEVDTGTRRFSTGYTTPPLQVLKDILGEMEGNGMTDCVMEVSSHAIHQRRFGDTVFACGAFTNLTEDHLDYHKTMDEYFRVKLGFAGVVAASKRSPLSAGRRDLPPYAVCLDGGAGVEMYEAAGVLPLNVIPVTVCKPRFNLSGLRLAGDYNKSNVLLAAALAEAERRMTDAVNGLFGSDGAAAAFFGTMHPFSPVSGEFYATQALQKVGQFIGAQFDTETRAMSKRAKKYLK
jgi:UDP-N-acetylmuramoyl-L-alanyl-D-glutamate--2,6-diaminopimelate ligase